MITSKVSKKGLTNIPARVRKALNIEEGDILIWEVDEEHSIAIVKVIKNPTKYLEGKYNDPNLTYEKVEEIGDEVIVGEAHASN